MDDRSTAGNSWRAFLGCAVWRLHRMLHVLVGYDQDGHCPMLIDNACSIYAHRPRTCRTYDCRVFPAARVELDDADKAAIARQTRRWQFSFDSPNARVQHDAVPANTTQLAVLAIEVHDAFVERDPETGMTKITVPTPDAVRVMVTSRRRSQRGRTPGH